MQREWDDNENECFKSLHGYWNYGVDVVSFEAAVGALRGLLLMENIVREWPASPHPASSLHLVSLQSLITAAYHNLLGQLSGPQVLSCETQLFFLLF